MREDQSETTSVNTPSNNEEPNVSSGAESIEAIVRRYESQLLRYVAHTIGPEYEEEQDVVQEVFIRLNRQIQRKGLNSIKNLKCWLYRVAYNLAMDTGRRRRRLSRKRNELTEDPVYSPSQNSETTGSPEENKGRQEMHQLAMQELDQLPPEQRNVVLLKMIEDMTLREISDATDLKIGTVNYRLTQGLKNLAERLKAYGAME